MLRKLSLQKKRTKDGSVSFAIDDEEKISTELELIRLIAKEILDRSGQRNEV